ncbi:MAG TPA: cyanophycin synthetase [Candidatus Limnocylindria bacterium]|nr:cyanophycin synthetase [Candidatus Limnocylindria bacterium]
MTRRSEEIGRGLAAARPARPIEAGEPIHVLGAAGAGASAAALLAQRAGAHVSGCDPGGPSPYTTALEAAGISLEWRHSPTHLEPMEGRPPRRLAVTKALTAVDPDQPELAAARRLGIPAEPWQQVVADAAATSGKRLLAVAGTHGKSTTTGWLIHLLVEAGRDPSAFVGALLDARLSGGLPATARWGGGDTFVVEADEYAGNFDPYRPDVALLLNAEWDHPDVFADEAAVVEAFSGWLSAAAGAGRRPQLVANVGSPGVSRILGQLSGWPGSVLTVALDGAAGPAAAAAAADLTARVEPRPESGSRLTVSRRGGSQQSYEVGLAGLHNAENALVVVGAAQLLGVEEEALRASLAGFGGVGRRLERKGEAGGVLVLDDYGHHPTAIERTIEAVRLSHPGRRLWAVYEPLTYHRTAHMLERFADVLAGADQVAIADIWAGRDPDTTVTSSAALAAAIAGRGQAPAQATGSVEETADHLAQRVRPGDVVLVMGGGRAYVIAERLLELLGRAPAEEGGAVPGR